MTDHQQLVKIAACFAGLATSDLESEEVKIVELLKDGEFLVVDDDGELWPLESY